MPNFNFVNQESLDNILKAKVFIHSNGQLRAAHLILGYTSISKSFQVPKCIIKAKDPRLHWISITTPSFLVSRTILEGTLATTPILEGIPRVAPPRIPFDLLHHQHILSRIKDLVRRLCQLIFHPYLAFLLLLPMEIQQTWLLDLQGPGP